ncbi:MAG: hypothetical protein ACRD82_09850 [Blastocatellia bacterium]
MTTDILALSRQARANLTYDSPLEPDDTKWVDLNPVRGDFSESKMLYTLGIVGEEALMPLPGPLYLAFSGHRGCGKSTELRRMEKRLQRHDRYFVVFIDVLNVLDVNNLRYSDILLAQAKALFDRLAEQRINLDQVFLTNLENWFKERIEKHDTTRNFAAEIKAGSEARGGLPWFVKIFGALSDSIRVNSTYKTEIRENVRNSFKEFADAFNPLLIHAEERLAAANHGKKILFIVDGTDRLRGEDAEYFFIRDVYQLKLIEACFIYCAPIRLLSEHGDLQQTFELLRLPMIKISDKSETSLLIKSRDVLRDLVYHRVDCRLFDFETTVDYLIRYSGGHVRDLVRPLNYCLAETLGQRRIDSDCAQRAVKQLATEYRRLIQQDDYSLLKKIDQSGKDYTPNTDATRCLLYDLVLLEYNVYWWQSHPVVTTLNAYQSAQVPP